MTLQFKNSDLGKDNYYETTVTRLSRPSLMGRVDADAIIVGAGLAGLSAAIELAQRGMKVVVLEAQRVCAGPSGRNGGQALTGFACGQVKLEQQLGLERAQQAWQMSLEALELIRSRIAQFGIECDAVWSYLTVADSARKSRALHAEADLMAKRYQYPMAFLSRDGLDEFIASARYQTGLVDPFSGHLNPLRYGLGLALAAESLGVKIYEHSAVLKLERGETLLARTAMGEVHAPWGLLSGNCALQWEGPNVARDIRARIMPAGTYMVATEPLPAQLCERLMPRHSGVCDNNFELDYFRFGADCRMLFGGRVSYSGATPLNLRDVLRLRMVSIFPELASAGVAHTWGGFVDISFSRMPDFGRLAPNLYYLQGFSGHGLALTGLAGKLVAQAMCGQAERFDLLAGLRQPAFPGGDAMRVPLLVLGMLYNRLRDKF